MTKRISDKVYSETEQARHSCEVNHVCTMSEKQKDAHLAGVHEERGFEAYKKLRDDVAKLWRK